MKVITPGHKYELANFEASAEQLQTIQFIQKEPVPGGEPGQLQTVANGTTNEELITVLIDRLQYLSGKFPCRENALATTKLEEALMWLNRRTANRMARGVEGKALA